jgi:hypothetical protein
MAKSLIHAQKLLSLVQTNMTPTNLCNDHSKSKLTTLWANPQLEVNVYDM